MLWCYWYGRYWSWKQKMLWCCPGILSSVWWMLHGCQITVTSHCQFVFTIIMVSWQWFGWLPTENYIQDVLHAFQFIGELVNISWAVKELVLFITSLYLFFHGGQLFCPFQLAQFICTATKGVQRFAWVYNVLYLLHAQYRIPLCYAGCYGAIFFNIGMALSISGFCYPLKCTSCMTLSKQVQIANAQCC